MTAWRTVACLSTSLISLLAQADTLCPPNQKIQFAHHNFGYFYSEDGGIDVDLVAELARRSGCPFNQTVKPRSRIWQELEQGALEMAGNGIETDARNQFAAFIPYIAVRARLLYNGEGNAPASVDELLQRNLRVGVIRSFKHGEPYDSAVDYLRQQGQVVEARDMPQLLEWLQKKRIQAAITHPLVYLRYLPGLQIDKLQIVDLATHHPTIKASVILSRKHFSPEQIDGWRKLLQSMRDDGTLRNIYTRYIGADNADAALRQISPSGK